MINHAWSVAHHSGATLGTFGVTGSGSAKYSITLQVPPGTKGMSPTLQLIYRSSKGNGLLGVGWSLSGVSKVYRCPQTIVQDGKIKGVDYTATDKFCLDGQRLTAVSGEYGDDSTEYKTEIASYTKIVSYGGAGTGPAHFKVWTKSGQIIEYGNTADSRILAQGKSEARAWAVNKNLDTSGNYMQYSYFQDTAIGHYRLDRIDYSGNDNTGTTPSASVRMVYETRTDATVGYVAGSKYSMPVRLSKVQTYVGPSLVKEYQLNYEYGAATKQSRLTKLLECGNNDVCKLSSSFDWSSNTNGFSGQYYSSDFSNCTVQFGDFNGDGIRDIYVQGSSSCAGGWNSDRILVGDGKGTFTSWYSSSQSREGCKVVLGDFNGDGKTDVIYQNDSGTCGGWDKDWGMLSTGTGFNSNYFYQSTASRKGCRIVVGDYNGDGRADIIYKNDSGICGGWDKDWGMLSTGTGFSNDYFYQSSASRKGCSIVTGDFNGDGKTDIIYKNNSGTCGGWDKDWGRLSNGTGFVSSYFYQSSSTRKDCTIVTGDFNGDGKTDIIYQNSSGICGGWDKHWGMLSKGNSFDTNYFFVSEPNRKGCNIVAGDYNGDGKTDIIYKNISGTCGGWGKDWGRLSNGISFDSNYFFQSTSIRVGCSLFSVDLNSDGKDDLYYRNSSGACGGWNKDWGVLTNTPGVSVDKLVGINNGLGDKITINYKPLTDTSVYTKGTGAIYPVRDVQNARYVVSSYSKSDGIGGMYAFNYKYSGAKVHVQGRGYLGFKSIAITDTRAGTVTTTTYNQSWPTNGLIVKSEMRTSANILLESTNNSYQVVDLGLGRKAVHLQTKVVVKNELNGALVTQVTNTNTYDSFGNATSIAVASNDGYSTTTTSQYSNNTANWIIGRLTNITVTKSAPNTSPITRESSFAYDPNTGLVTQLTIQPNDANYQLTTSYSYDSFGNKTSSTVSGVGVAARTTSATFDARGQFPTSVRNALGHTTTVSYDPQFGNKLTQTGPNGLTTTWLYDSLGRKTTVTRADGSVTTTSYNLCQGVCDVGQPLSITFQNTGSVPVTFSYDPLGREVKRSTFGFANQPITRITTYDTFGRVSSVSSYHFDGQNNYKTQYQYDLFGRLTRETKANNAVTNINYSVLSRTHTNDKGQTVTRIKNSQGWLIKSIDHNGSANIYTHNAFGNLLSVTDAGGNVTSMAYNIRGQKTSMDDPNMGHWEYRYNALGQLTWQKNAKNQQTILAYDLLTRLVVRTDAEGTSAWTYDTATKGLGKMARVDGVGGYFKVYAYDSLSRLTSSTTTINGQALTQSVTYGNISRPSTRTYPTGFKTQNVYNAQGYLSQIKNVATNKVYWKALTMNARGQLIEHVLGNNVTTSTAYDDSTGRVNGITSGNGNVQNLIYTFDSIGNLTERKDTKQNINETFTYDNLNRLTSNTVTGSTNSTKNIQYDIIGNITSKTDVGTYLYQKTNAGLNAVTKVTSSTGQVTNYTYDANGNMTSGDGRTLTYSSFNKPLTIAKGGTTNTYAYDASRMRLSKNSVKGTDTTNTLYLGKSYERVTISTSSTNVTEHKHYIPANGTTIIYTSRTNNINDTRYLHKDHIGSTDAITNEQGQVVERASFNAWGERRLSNWTGSPSVILSLTTRGFTGHEMDDGVGLINMNARMYDAKLGRFLQPDTYIQFPETTQGFNRYSYVNNNPLSYTDPTGNFFDGGEREVSFSDRDDIRSIAQDIEIEEGNEPENTDSDPGLRGLVESSKGDAIRLAGDPPMTLANYMAGPNSPYSNRTDGDQGLKPVAIISGPIVIGLAVRVLWGLATAGTAAAGYDVVKTARRRAADRALNARSGFRSSDDSGSTGSDSKTTPDDANTDPYDGATPKNEEEVMGNKNNEGITEKSSDGEIDWAIDILKKRERGRQIDIDNNSKDIGTDEQRKHYVRIENLEGRRNRLEKEKSFRDTMNNL